MAGLTLDAGALIGLERRSSAVHAALSRAASGGRDVRVPAAVLAQVWRNGSRHSMLSRLLAAPGTSIVELDRDGAQRTGELLGRTRTSDPVDASVVVCARVHQDVVVTSDPGDLLVLDPSLVLFVL